MFLSAPLMVGELLELTFLKYLTPTIPSFSLGFVAPSNVGGGVDAAEGSTTALAKEDDEGGA